MFLRVSGSRTVLATASWSLVAISLLVPPGRNTAYHWTTPKPGRPDSATVGYSGNAGVRLLPTVASARSLPVVNIGRVETTLATVTAMRPATTSRTLGAVPL